MSAVAGPRAVTGTPSTAASGATGGRPLPLALEGARAVAPMVLSVLPLGLAIGATIEASSVPDAVGVLGGLLIFGGAAQLTAVQMLDQGAATAVVVVSALLVNARVLMYGAAMGRWFRTESLPMRLLLAAPLIDPVYFTAVARFERGGLDRRGRRAFYLGAAGALGASWVGVQIVAVVAGASLPEWTGLHLAAPLAFAGLLARSVPTPDTVVAAVVAGAGAVVLAGLPLHSAVLVASVLAVGAGRLAQRRGRPPAPDAEDDRS